MCVSSQTRFEVMTDNFHLLLLSIYSYTPGHVPKQLCNAQNFGDLVIITSQNCADAFRVILCFLLTLFRYKWKAKPNQTLGLQIKATEYIYFLKGSCVKHYTVFKVPNGSSFHNLVTIFASSGFLRRHTASAQRKTINTLEKIEARCTFHPSRRSHARAHGARIFMTTVQQVLLFFPFVLLGPPVQKAEKVMMERRGF